MPRHIQVRPCCVLRAGQGHEWMERTSFCSGRSRVAADSHAGNCVIFATLQDSFNAATLRDKFSVPMLLGYYSKRGCLIKSLVVKRSIVVSGHRTSVSLEDAF